MSYERSKYISSHALGCGLECRGESSGMILNSSLEIVIVTQSIAWKSWYYSECSLEFLSWIVSFSHSGVSVKESRSFMLVSTNAVPCPPNLVSRRDQRALQRCMRWYGTIPMVTLVTATVPPALSSIGRSMYGNRRPPRAVGMVVIQ